MDVKSDCSKTPDAKLYADDMYTFFRRGRLANIIGHFAVSMFTASVIWDQADHNRLLIYLVLHQCFTLFMAFSFFLPWTNKRRNDEGIPKFGIVSAVLAGVVGGSVLWIDFAAAANHSVAVLSLLVSFAAATGTMVTFGPIWRLARFTLFAVLLPGALAAIALGHFILGGGTLFFLLVIAIFGVRETRKAYSELIYLRDQSAKHASRFEHLANHDVLTGLLNRAGITQRFEVERSKIKSALFIDLDKFKQVNDQAGHMTGDILLQQTAKRLENKVIELGIVSRLGGDEFLILLYETDSQNLQEFAQSVITILEQPFIISGGEFSISASVGVSKIFEKSTLEEVLKESDDAMYLAKKTGRAKVMFFDNNKHLERERHIPSESRRVDWSHTEN